MSVYTRWRGRLAARRKLLAAAKARRKAAKRGLAWARREDRHPRQWRVDLVRELEKLVRKRKRQVAYAERVVERHRPLSPHFRVEEFGCHDGTPVPGMADDGLRRLCRDVLEPMRERFGACRVTSGYRHEAYNRSIGGASRSYHVYELRGGDEVAADVTFERGTPAEWAAYARRLGVGGVGQYDRSGFVHVDNGPRRDWWG